MELRVICDNEAQSGLQAAWGFSCLIDGDILFDTNGEYGILKGNMDAMGIHPDDVSAVVISHDHWDHAGGLPILRDMGKVDVFIPRGASRRLGREISKYENAHLIEVGDVYNVREGIDLVGDFGHPIDEIVSVVKGDLGSCVITGCAHPGLDTILKKASSRFDVRSAIGGFHDFQRIEGLSDLELIIPCHCTMLKDRILRRYPETSRPCSAGETFHV